MILWFAAGAILGAWSVLRDSSFDYRLVAVGALLPDVFDAVVGHRALAHTLVFAVGSLAAVMLATVGRRAARRHLIAVPIGLLAHLVLDGVFTDKTLFWWPGFGAWGSAAIAPTMPWLLVREVIGLALAVV
ncbi:MAG: hypothetical protein QOI61_2503, partial [Actinomycetota bacterium]